MKGPYVYKITIISIYNEPEKVAGITFSGSYSKAVKNLESYYGTDILSIDSIDEFEECEVLEVPIPVAEAIVKDNLDSYALVPKEDIK